MPRSFTTSYARQLIQQYQSVEQSLTTMKALEKENARKIQECVQKVLAAELMEALKEIPIEEVNRERLGIRVKALRDNGFVNFATIYTASIAEVASVRGISTETAQIVKKIVSKAAQDSYSGLKIRVNYDRQTPQYTALLSEVSRYQKYHALAYQCEELNRQYSGQYQESLETLQKGIGFFRWIFSSKEKKSRTEEAYEKLQQGLSGNFGRSVSQVHFIEQNALVLDDRAVWESFRENPIKYISTIDQIAPGTVGKLNTTYGLPEDLAKQVEEECFFPDGLLCDLRRYQEWGVKYILHQGRVLLGDEMGLGKTIQAIAAMVSLKNTEATHFMVVCPASVLVNWYREIRKFSKLHAIIVHGNDRNRAISEWEKDGGVAVTTYETTGYIHLLVNFQFSMLVVDEAHYIKNPQARRTRDTLQIAAHAQRLLFMTGTPIENNVDEMISLIRTLRPDIAGDLMSMKSIVNAPKFRNAIAPVYYRRKRQDVLTELPDLLMEEEWCRLGMEEEQTYEEEVLARDYNGARRVSWNIDNLENSCKAKRLLELIEEAKSEGRKVLVFSFYLDTIRKIKDLLGDICCEPINGSVPPARRQQIIDEFDSAPAGKVLAAQIIAGGTGLNIQSASVVILCEPQLKPSIENQAISRAYRMGQGRNVLVYRLLCENTIDERIMKLLEDKQKIFDAFADKSVAVEKIEVDNRNLDNLIQEEIDRINNKRKSA